MKIEEWDNLTGIKQDAIIAERVFGWQWIPYQYSDCIADNQLWLVQEHDDVYSLSPGEWVYVSRKKNQLVGANWTGRWAESVGTAWSMVEKINGECSLTRNTSWLEKYRYECIIQSYTPEKGVIAIEPTANRAITVAVLLYFDIIERI